MNLLPAAIGFAFSYFVFTAFWSWVCLAFSIACLIHIFYRSLKVNLLNYKIKKLLNYFALLIFIQLDFISERSGSCDHRV